MCRSDHVNGAHEEVVYLDERSGAYVTCAACQKEVTPRIRGLEPLHSCASV